MNTSKVRVRATNFTPAEADNLLKNIEEHKNTIENKKTDQMCVRDKLRAWELVARQCNATTCGGSRTVQNLQNAYKNLKKKTKKANSEKMTMPLKKEVPVHIVAEVGEDWPAVSQAVGAPEDQCEQHDLNHSSSFDHLKEEAKKQLIPEKKAVMGTGGEPPEKDDEDFRMERVQGLIGPTLDYESELVKMQLATEEIKFKEALAQYEHNQKIRALELGELKLKIERNKQLHDRELARI